MLQARLVHTVLQLGDGSHELNLAVGDADLVVEQAAGETAGGDVGEFVNC